MNRKTFLNCTLSDLKSLTGVYESNWSDWFTGKTSPKLQTLKTLSEKLDMPLGEFVEAFQERLDRTRKIE